MAIVYGLMGQRQSGKSTVAGYLHELYADRKSYHLEFSDPIIEVANAWKRSWGSPIDLHSSSDQTLAVHFNLNLSAGLTEALDDSLFTYAVDQQILLDDKDLRDCQRLFDYLRASSVDFDLYFSLIESQADKERHRALLQWLGGFLRTKLQDEDIWAAEISYRIDQFDSSGDELVTVGGIRFPSDADVIDEFDGQLIQIIRPGQASDRASADITEVAGRSLKPHYIIVNDSTQANLRQAVYALFGRSRK